MRKLLALLLICLSAFLLVACEEDDTVATGTMVDAPNATGAYSESYDGSATVIPTEQPTQEPTDAIVTEAPTTLPATEIPTQEPTEKPTEKPTERPTEKTTERPTDRPTQKPTQKPIVTVSPTATAKPAPTANVKPTTTVKPIPTATVKPLPTAQVTIKPNKELDNIITEKLLKDIEKEFINLVNKERALFKLPELSLNDVLEHGAQIRSEEMTVNKTHYRPDGSSYKTAVDRDSYYYLWITENLCIIPYVLEDFDRTGQEVAQTLFDTFKSSAGHYQNMVFDQFKDCGFGITCAIDDNTGYLNFYFCHILARR